MLNIKIDYKLLASEMSAILLPQLKEYANGLIERKSTEDKFVTIEEAMKILCFKSRRAITDKIKKGELTAIRDGRRITLNYNEVVASKKRKINE